jgi:hypothetical protein
VQGFAAQPVKIVTAAEQVAECELQLEVTPVRVGVTVGGTLSVHEPKNLSGPCRSETSLRPSAKRCKR